MPKAASSRATVARSIGGADSLSWRAPSPWNWMPKCRPPCQSEKSRPSGSSSLRAWKSERSSWALRKPERKKASSGPNCGTPPGVLTGGGALEIRREGRHHPDLSHFVQQSWQKMSPLSTKTRSVTASTLRHHRQRGLLMPRIAGGEEELLAALLWPATSRRIAGPESDWPKCVGGSSAPRPDRSCRRSCNSALSASLTASASLSCEVSSRKRFADRCSFPSAELCCLSSSADGGSTSAAADVSAPVPAAPLPTGAGTPATVSPADGSVPTSSPAALLLPAISCLVFSPSAPGGANR
mmetsp:Transcript_62604/g.186570  ORF Transcript_62604/g.186570 Transcript_62604/m.186570 type:complete len:297 (+) Transcript_62604:487-1377(+)